MPAQPVAAPVPPPQVVTPAVVQPEPIKEEVKKEIKKEEPKTFTVNKKIILGIFFQINKFLEIYF